MVVTVVINYQRLEVSKGRLDDRLAVFNKFFSGSNVIGLEFIEGVFCGLKIVTLGINPVGLCFLLQDVGGNGIAAQGLFVKLKTNRDLDDTP